MDKKILVRNTIALSAAIVLVGGVLAARAATNDNTVSNQAYQRGAGMGQAAKGQGWQNLSEEEKTKLEADREVRQQEAETRRAAAEAAINANDYQAWVAAVGTASPMAQKVTAANFSRFSEAHKLMTQARDIMSELGIEEGPGMGRGHGQGQGRGMMMHQQ